MARLTFTHLVAACLAVSACQRTEAPAPPASTPAPLAQSASAPVADADPPPPRATTASNDLARRFAELSEPDRYFFSDNYLSNETSYLQVVPELESRAKKGGAYIGVGPEQNFTYIAVTEPALAFIVDIRRGNALEQLLYKAIFEQATSRAHFLALLLGRAGGDAGAPAPDAALDDVLGFVAGLHPDPAVYSKIHGELVARIVKDFSVPLSSDDEKALEQIHRAFFDKGLELSFELHEKNGRKYPRLRELLTEKDSTGTMSGFLGSRVAFETVQRLERENRVIPVVGDFAGNHALAKIAELLRAEKLTLSVFYVSNVEQYLMEPEKWQAWVKNVNALPADDRTLFLRCYLDQGRKHPLEMPGHRTATFLQGFDRFKQRQAGRGYGSFWQLVTDLPKAG